MYTFTLLFMLGKRFLVYGPQKPSANFILKNVHALIVSLHLWTVSSYLSPLGALLLIETPLMVSKFVLLDLFLINIDYWFLQNGAKMLLSKVQTLRVSLSVLCHT